MDQCSIAASDRSLQRFFLGCVCSLIDCVDYFGCVCYLIGCVDYFGCVWYLIGCVDYFGCVCCLIGCVDYFGCVCYLFGCVDSTISRTRPELRVTSAGHRHLTLVNTCSHCYIWNSRTLGKTARCHKAARPEWTDKQLARSSKVCGSRVNVWKCQQIHIVGSLLHFCGIHSSI